MFTVKHRRADGSETIYEAECVSRENGPEPQIPAGGDIILSGCPIGSGGPGSISNLEGQIRVHAGERQSGGFDPLVWVMNRFGATVATYHL